MAKNLSNEVLKYRISTLSGKTTRELSTLWGISMKSTYCCLKKLKGRGVDLSGWIHKKRTKITEEELSRRTKIIFESHSRREAAKKIGMCENSLNKFLQDYNLGIEKVCCICHKSATRRKYCGGWGRKPVTNIRYFCEEHFGEDTVNKFVCEISHETEKMLIKELAMVESWREEYYPYEWKYKELTDRISKLQKAIAENMNEKSEDENREILERVI